MLSWLLESDFMPHGHCYLWRADILWTHVISDGVIALSYFSIPLTLLYFLRRRPDLPFPGMVVLFAIFIVLCGSGHVLEIWTVWNPNYTLQGIEKAMTAIASILTAVALVPIIPQVLAMRTPAQIQQEVDEALARLKNTQAQLAKNERMAALGQVVAGIAHEINTPVGIGVTAASNLQFVTDEINQKFKQSTMTKSDLERYMATARESSDILLRNLQRAAELIQSFKQVAVDQSSGQRRRIVLKSYLDEVITSLAPQLKRSPHKVIIDCPAEVEMDTQPGSLAQIVSNLVGNSLVHAFPDGRTGSIRIAVGRKGDNVEIEFSDDGVGVPPELQDRVFEPFFTTRRDEGGSGLGLHIVQNLVTESLGGTVAFSSTPGSGTKFLINIPASTPVMSVPASPPDTVAVPAAA